MNSLTIVLMVLVGLVAIYAAIKGVDPRELIKNALQRNK